MSATCLLGGATPQVLRSCRLSQRLLAGIVDMPRIARVAPPGCAFHVTHRGNRRTPVFFQAGDERRYLEILRENATKWRLAIWSYCLMPNHVHLLVCGENSDSLARGIGNAHRRYARMVNRRAGWTGHLWANRFFSTPLDERHLWAAVRYVETNPVRAGLVKDAESFPWSSACAHVGGREDPVLSDGRPFPGDVEDWSGWLKGHEDPAVIQSLRRNTAAGRPSGSPQFVESLETRLGRRLAARSRGGQPLKMIEREGKHRSCARKDASNLVADERGPYGW